MVSDYTPPPVTQATLKGAPSVTVSPVGLAQGLPRNNNANYGPDTPGTTTCGINEAIASGATEITLISIPGSAFNTSESIMLPATHGIDLLGRGSQSFNDGPAANVSYIDYSGTGYAIDTAASPVQNIKGYIDGIFIESPNGSGVHFNGVVYDIGYLGCVGGGVAGSIGINFDFLSAPSMAHIKMLRVGVYPLHIRINQDHFTCDHIETSFTIAAQNAIIEKVAGWGMHIGYWHHYCSGAAPANGLLIDNPATGNRAMFVGSILWEPSAYAVPTVYVINNSAAGAYPLSIGIISGATANINSYISSSVYGLNEGATTASVPLLAVISKINVYNNNYTAGYGVAPIYGLDNRRGLTAADTAAITLYTVPAGSTATAFKVNLRALLTAGTSPAATYKVAWTEGGVAQVATITLSALNSISVISLLIQPDVSTVITAQLSAISGTGTTANVSTTVEEVA